MNIRNDRSLRFYLNSLRKFKPLPKQEEISLIVEYHKTKDRKVFQKVVEANLRFVVQVAHRFSNEFVDIKDLINEGNLGLMKAVERFKPQKDIKFLSYAVWWIRQSILKSLYDNGRLIRFPCNKIALINKINKLSEESLQQSKDLDIEFISKELNISEDQLLDIIYYETLSMDQSGKNKDGGDSFTFHDTLATQEDGTEQRLEDQGSIDYLCKILNDKEKFILEQYYKEQVKLTEIGKKLNLTKERVRQIREQAIKKIRNSCQFVSFF